MKIKWPTWVKKTYQRLRLGYNPANPKMGSTICAVPWMHLAFEPSGRVVPCCLTTTNTPASGNLNKQSIEDIWNGPVQRKLRKTMLAGQEPKMCSKCFNKEKVSGESSRINHNVEFPHVVKNISNITNPDGSVKEMKLKYWDFRFSNLCNFKCRSCGPGFSSAWVPDSNKLSRWRSLSKVTEITSVEDRTNYDFLEEQVEHVERIYFAGGEPLLMREHWQILDLLVNNKRFNVRLSYNTNCSTFTYGKKNVIDYWKQWDKNKIEVWPSIDEIGNRAELIRSGTVWSTVESNLKQLAELNNIRIRPSITVGAMNIFRLPEIIDHLVSIEVINKKYNYANFSLNLLEDPEYYHVHILSEKFRNQITIKLKTWITEYNHKHNTDITSKFTQMLYELSKPTNNSARKHFVSLTKKLDQIRNEDTYKTIPELMDVLHNE